MHIKFYYSATGCQNKLQVAQLAHKSRKKKNKRHIHDHELRSKTLWVQGSCGKGQKVLLAKGSPAATGGENSSALCRLGSRFLFFFSLMNNCELNVDYRARWSREKRRGQDEGGC